MMRLRKDEIEALVRLKTAAGEGFPVDSAYPYSSDKLWSVLDDVRSLLDALTAEGLIPS